MTNVREWDRGNEQQHRQALVWPRRHYCHEGLARLLALALLNATARSTSADIRIPYFLNLSYHAVSQSLSLPPAFSSSFGVCTLSVCEFILYIEHLKPLRESSNNQ